MTLFVSVAYNFVRFWEYRKNENGQIDGLLRNQRLYMILYINVATTLSQFAVPLTTLCTLNLRVAQTIVRAGEQRRALSASERREHNTAKMMLFVVLGPFFCHKIRKVENLHQCGFHIF